MQALAFIDLLGFSNMVTNDMDEARKVLNDFYNITFDIIKNEDTVDGELFSDSLFARSSDPAILVNTITKIYRECLKQNKLYDETKLSTFFLLPRGGISLGVIDIQNRTESPNLNKSFIVSPALVHSAKMEGSIKGSRLLIADIRNNNQITFNWNRKIKSILYEDSSITLWKNFQYFDALWFLDLSKNPDKQKEDLIELINIAIKLVHANSSSAIKYLHQHLETLRLGLLSYSIFLKPHSSDIIVKKIIDEFEDEKYWIVWLALFEMIMQSPDYWAYTSNKDVIGFYKSISLKSSWAHVIKEINIPNNTYKKELLNKFIDELYIVGEE